jgi:limonene-1,2-epoxide hydrolase
VLLAATLALVGADAAQAAPSPASVVRAWSRALNANDNEHAARLFATGAHVVQPGVDVRLTTHRLAVAFNAALPCGGRITEIRLAGNAATATFVLGKRPKHRCDGPGQKAAARFVVQHGKIVRWQQVPVPESPTA